MQDEDHDLREATAKLRQVITDHDLRVAIAESASHQLDKIAGKDAADDLMELFRHLGNLGPNDSYGRDIVCTPFDGAYGHVGWVIVLNGSPARAIIVIPNDRDLIRQDCGVYVEGTMTSSRRLGSAQRRTVAKFHQDFLDKKTASVTVKTKDKR